MQRAQKRDAARSGKFYFRRDVYLHDRSRASSAASCSSGSANGSVPKQKKLGNCFAPPNPPVNGELKVPVQDEYEEMSMDNIINGQVCMLLLYLTTPQVNRFTGRKLPGSSPPSSGIP